MSGVEKNTRRQIAQRPKKLISKILNQWAMDTRIYSCWCCVKNVLDSAALFVFVCFLLAVVSFWGFADLLWFPVFSAELLPTVSNIFLVPMEGPWNCGFSCCTFFGLTWGGQQIFMVYMLWWNVSWINNKLSECHRLCSLKGVGFGEFCPKWRFFMKQAIHDLPWLDENLIWFSIHKDLWLICFFKLRGSCTHRESIQILGCEKIRAATPSLPRWSKRMPQKWDFFCGLNANWNQWISLIETNGCQLSHEILLFFLLVVSRYMLTCDGSFESWLLWLFSPCLPSPFA